MARVSKTPTVKPIKALQNRKSQEECSLSEFCDLLKICQGTARNWVKKGRIKAIEGKGPLRFRRREIEALLESIESGDTASLMSRRNKRHKKGLQIPSGIMKHGIYGAYVSQLLALLPDRPLSVQDRSLLLAEYALRLLVQRGLVLSPSVEGSFLKAYREGRLPLGQVQPLIDDLLSLAPDQSLSEDAEETFSRIRIPESYDEDFLGFLYMLLQCIGERKANGVYYTPSNLVKSSIDSMLSCDPAALDGSVLDPCCGTGQFILQVMQIKQQSDALSLDSHQAYWGCHGFDVDPISVHLTRINVVLFTKRLHIQALYGQFRIQDTLQLKGAPSFDCILGNPPWGYTFSEQEIASLASGYSLMQGSRHESYGLFVEWAKNRLKPGGWLSYILPEAALTVKGHKPLRRLIHQAFDMRAADFLENAFEGVYMPAIALHLQLKGLIPNSSGIRIQAKGTVNLIATERYDERGAFILRASDEAYLMVREMDLKAKLKLRGHGVFALGMVTGDNKGSLYKSKGSDRVPVLVGPDVRPYALKRPSRYIDRSQSYQQRAPMDYYEAAEKLVYRFIADRPIVAYDTDRRLTLNSCNCFIPDVEGYSAKVIMAVLNASPIQFYYKTLFPSMKVLRAHLEEMPIPWLTEAQKEELESCCDALMGGPKAEAGRQLLHRINDIVCDAFGLSAEDRGLLAKTLEKKGDAYARRS